MSVNFYKSCIVCASNRLFPFRKVGQFELVRCEQCNLIFCNNFELEEIQKFYSEEYFGKLALEHQGTFGSYENSEFVIRYYARIILRQIEKYREEPGRLLDVGAGFGYFLNEARLKGWEVFGVEASKKGCLYAKENFKISLVHSLFENNTEFDRFQYDVITCLGVLDHSSAPHKMIKKAYSLLKANGLMVSTAQNIDWWLKIVDFRLPEHLFYFSGNNLSQLYRKSGFRIIANRPFLVPFSVEEFIRRAISYYLRLPQLASYICPFFNFLFKNTIIKIPNENLIIAQKV